MPGDAGNGRAVMRGRLLSAVLAVGLAPAAAQAAGFAIKQQSATAQGNAFAGATAGAESPSYMFFNPAALGRFDESSVQLEASAIFTELRLRDSQAATTAGVPIDGTRRKGDNSDDAVLPSFYGLLAPKESDFRFGLGVNVPFGLGTEYPTGWVGRYHTQKSNLLTVNINPVMAYKATDWLTVAAGLQFQYAEAELENAVDFGTSGAGAGIIGALPTQQDGSAKVEGDGWGYGFNIGVLAEPRQGTRLGAAFRSKIDTTLNGDARFKLDDAGIGAAISAGTGAFQDVNAETEVNLPPMVSFGVHQDIGDRFAVMAEAQWTGWSTFDDLVIEFDNPAQPDNVTQFEWDDAWFFAVGGTWKPTERLTFRVGAAYDETPTRNRYRTPRIPDSDRYWLAAGIGWQVTNQLSFDLAYTHVFFDDARVRLDGTDEGNAARGDLDASYRNAIDIVTLAAKWQF
jgi:long-chain fatty acid transport protein